MKKDEKDLAKAIVSEISKNHIKPFSVAKNLKKWEKDFAYAVENKLTASLQEMKFEPNKAIIKCKRDWNGLLYEYEIEIKSIGIVDGHVLYESVIFGQWKDRQTGNTKYCLSSKPMTQIFGKNFEQLRRWIDDFEEICESPALPPHKN